MRRISVAHRPDVLVVRVGRDTSRLALWGAVFVGLWALDARIDFGSPAQFTFTLLLQLATLPVLGVALWRLAQASERTLVRAQGRLLLDGEPLELARVELRVDKMPITRLPTGYALSLWVVTASGPEDVPLGRARTLLEASALSGQLEDFVQRASLKQHRLA